jgi:protein-tyrosine phosphatase
MNSLLMAVNKIKSILVVLSIFIQKTADTFHSYWNGLPMLRRSQITASLFLGSQYNLIGLQKLKALGITAIVNMRTHNVYGEALHLGIIYFHLPTIDNTPPTLFDLIKGADFVEHEIKNGGRVYIHCRQGIGRGPTMTMAYLIKAGATYDDAYQIIKKVRPFINPTQGQTARLKELEKYFKQK